MASLGFIRTLFLLGAAGALIPLLIHLVERDRVQRVVFGSVWFLRNVSRNIIRRRRTAEMILVALRMLIIAVLALAFARPFLWPEGAVLTGTGAPGSGKALLVLIDASASMSVGDRASDAKAKAIEAIDRGAYGRVAVASFGTQLDMLCSFDDGADAAKQAVESLEGGMGGTDLAGVLKRASEVVGAAGEFEKGILVISDLHRSAWSGYRGDWKLPEDITLSVEDVATEIIPNTAILQMAWPLRMVAGPTPRVITGKMANYGTEAREVKISLVVDDKVEEESKLIMQPGAIVPIRFSRVFDKPGVIAGKVVLSPADGMPADDASYFAAQVVPKVRVLLINGQSGVTDIEKNDGFFLRAALAPTPDSPCQVREVAPGKFRPEDLSNVEVVVVANAGSIPAGSSAALKTFVELGGGAIFFPGSNVSPGAFNSSFGNVTPCKLRSLVDLRLADPDTDGATIGELDFSHEIFRIFAAPHQGDFSGARFLRYFQVKDSQAASVLARFDNGAPAVLEKAVGAGYSVMVTSSAAPNAPRWNDLSVQAIFLPLLHQMIGRITVGGAGSALSVRAGTRANVQVTGKVDQVQLTLPSGKALSLKVSDHGGAEAQPGSMRTADFSPEATGVYRVLWGTSEVAVAVNLDPGEADPAKQSIEEMAAALGAAPDKVNVDTAAAAADTEAAHAEAVDAKQQVWWYLLLGILAALSIEMVLAFKTARR